MTIEMVDEKDLLLRARQLDSTALGLIYDYLSPPSTAMRTTCWGILVWPKSVWPIPSSASSRLFKEKKDHTTHLKAYLYRIAHNWITDHYRYRSNRDVELSENLIDDKPDPHAEVHGKFEREYLRKIMQKLTPEQQQVIILRYVEEYENEEVAKIMNKSVGSVKAMQHRALAALRQNLLKDELRERK